MGRYAQSRRRGGDSAPAAELGPPPAPQFVLTVTNVYLEATSGSDVGGTYALQWQFEGAGEFVDIDSIAWLPSWDLGLIADRTGHRYRAYEMGNGVNYVGNSAFSEVLDLVV